MAYLLSLFLLVFSFSAFSAEKKDAPLYLFPLTPGGKAINYINANPKMYLNEQGIPYFRYPHGDEPNLLFLTTYALSLFDDYLLNGNDVDEQNLFTQVDWLMANLTTRDVNGIEFLTYESNYENRHYEATPKWTSALTNGRMLALFSQLYKYYGDESYLHTANLLFKSFLIDKSQGGIASFGENYWLEEVADYDIPSYKILNGHIGAVMGLWTYYKNIPSALAKKYLDKSIQTVALTIADFDAGYTSYYDLNLHSEFRKLAAVGGYNHQHIRQLEWLYCAEPEQAFLQYAIELNKYETPNIEIFDQDKNITAEVTSRFSGKYFEFTGTKTLRVKMQAPAISEYLYVVSYPTLDAPNLEKIEAQITDSSGQIINIESSGGGIARENRLPLNDVIADEILLHLTAPIGKKVLLGSIGIKTQTQQSSSSNWWMRNSSNNSNKLFTTGYRTARDGNISIELGQYTKKDVLHLNYKLPTEQNIEPKLKLKCADEMSQLATRSSVSLEPKLISSTEYQFSFKVHNKQFCNIEYIGFGSQGVLNIAQ